MNPRPLPRLSAGAGDALALASGPPLSETQFRYSLLRGWGNGGRLWGRRIWGTKIRGSVFVIRRRRAARDSQCGELRCAYPGTEELRGLAWMAHTTKPKFQTPVGYPDSKTRATFAARPLPSPKSPRQGRCATRRRCQDRCATLISASGSLRDPDPGPGIGVAARP